MSFSKYYVGIVQFLPVSISSRNSLLSLAKLYVKCAAWSILRVNSGGDEEGVLQSFCLSVPPHQTPVLRRGPPDSVAVSMISSAWVTNGAALAPLRLLSKKWITSLISSLLSRSIQRLRNWWAVTGLEVSSTPLSFSLFFFLLLSLFYLSHFKVLGLYQVSDGNTMVLWYIGI